MRNLFYVQQNTDPYFATDAFDYLEQKLSEF